MQWPGSQRRVQQLVDEHYLPLYRYAYRLSGSAADAEDLTQEAVCKAQMQMHQLRDPGRAKAWLFSILRNAYLHRRRSARHQACIPLDGIGDLPDPQEEPLADFDPERLQQALGELPGPSRTPSLVFYFEDVL